MSNRETLELLDQQVAQLPLDEQLKLVAHISERLSALIPSMIPSGKGEETWQERIQLAQILLAECDDIEDDSQGELDAAENIRLLRETRMSQLCKSAV